MTTNHEQATHDEKMFEQMFGVGDGTAPIKKPRGVIGGAMFWDSERGSFFQRRSENVDGLRREITEGLLLEPVVREDGPSYELSAQMPCGSWELRWLEADQEAKTLSVTLGAGDKNNEEDAEWATVKQALRVSRTFTLPDDADVVGGELDVVLDEGVVTLKVSKKAGDTPSLAPSVVPEPAEASLADVATPSTPPLSPPRAPRQKARVKGSMRAGFLNGKAKPRRVDFVDDQAGAPPLDASVQTAVAPMEVESCASAAAAC